MSQPVTTASPDRSSSWILACGLLFAVTAVACMFALEATTWGPAARLAMVVLPVALFGALIWRWIVMLRGADELERRVQLDALALAYPAAILLVFGAGFLERAGLAVPGFRDLRDAWPLLVVPYFVGLILARRRYQ